MNVLRSSYVFLDTVSLDTPSASLKTGKLDADDVNEFALHCMIVQTTAVRLSWKQKLQFYTKLVKAITSFESIFLLVGSLKPPMDGKSWLYSELSYESNYTYDAVTRYDHCRSLDVATFEDHEDDEVAWFSKLPFSQQIVVMTNLLRISGGSVCRQIYRLLMNLLRERLQDVSTKDDTPGSSSTTKHPTPVSYDSIHEESQTYQKLQVAKKEWKDKIDKYKKEVEGKPKLSKSVGRISDEKKSKKSDKSSDGRTKSKSVEPAKKPSKPKQVLKRGTETSHKSRRLKSKSSSSTKNKAKKDKNESDYLQLMPIWTNMKIFNYLDDKTLRKIKQVNSYWSYVSDLVEEERKARKLLNKTIKKLEAELDKDVVIDDVYKKFQYDYYNVTEWDQKIHRMANRGTCDKRVLGKSNSSKNTCEWALFMDALMLMREQIVLPVHYLTVYPRLKRKKDQPPIYQFPFCCLRDINFTFENTEDIVRDTYKASPSTPSEINQEQMTNPPGCLLSDESSTSKSSFPYWESANLNSW